MGFANISLPVRLADQVKWSPMPGCDHLSIEYFWKITGIRSGYIAKGNET